MTADTRFQMAVEAPHESVLVVRVTGDLDRAAGANLTRLIDAQLACAAMRNRRLLDLLVDVEGVRAFAPGGLEAVRHARHRIVERGVRIHLTGCSGRFHLLPLRARRLLGEFTTFPTVEVALAELARSTGPGPSERSSTRERATAPSPVVPQPRRHHDGPGDLRRRATTSTARSHVDAGAGRRPGTQLDR